MKERGGKCVHVHAHTYMCEGMCVREYLLRFVHEYFRLTWHPLLHLRAHNRRQKDCESPNSCQRMTQSKNRAREIVTQRSRLNIWHFSTFPKSTGQNFGNVGRNCVVFMCNVGGNALSVGGGWGGVHWRKQHNAAQEERKA